MFLAGVILSIVVLWFYQSQLSRRDRLVRVFLVSFLTFLALPVIGGLTDKLPFDSLKEAVEKAVWPVLILALCGFVVSTLGLLWFELVLGETSYESCRVSSGWSWGGGFDGESDGGGGDWGD